MKDLDITIDDNNNIRVLPIEKYTASQKLKGESNKFVSKIIQFNDLIKSIAEVLEKHSKVIENEKLKALGKRNQLYDEIESRGKREQELKVLIREKKEELERLKYQRESLLKIEAEQKMTIEKLSNNDE
jgi:intraflagellar transport protein 20